MAWAAKTSVLAAVAAAAVLSLAGCWQSHQDLADAATDDSADTDAHRTDADDGTTDEADVIHDGDAEADLSADATDVLTCGGAWLDPTTGYLWENPPPVARMNWDDAVAYCNGLTLCGYGPGSWNLPTISELRSLIRGCPTTVTGGSCGVTDSCLGESCLSELCWSCDVLSGPGPGGCYWDSALGRECSLYWSSSSYGGGASYAWAVYFSFGNVEGYGKLYAHYVRCLRRGP